MSQHFAFFDDQATGRQLYFTSPKSFITAQNPHEVETAFNQIEAALAEGFYVAGYCAYELGFALEPSLRENISYDAPLIHLAVFGPPSDTPPAELLYTSSAPKINLTPLWTEDEYLSRFKRLRDYIKAGDCYQVNLTFPLQGETQFGPEQIYAAFRQRQPGRYGAQLSLGGSNIMSFSPELFFERKGQDVRMRPMKGTRPRAPGDDAHIAEAMRAEPKSQAENLMIVDLLRNDLSRLAEVGSVKVPELFTLETYPTVHQMTSQVTAKLRKNIKWIDIFKGLFPCGSVTGAPKIRAMEIIEELESGHRGPYCGAIGFIEPNGDACFNVAIRTAVLKDKQLTYNVGSGVVFDSDGQDEYQECLLKSNLLNRARPHLIETLYWSPEDGYRQGEAHLDRLRTSAGTPDIVMPLAPQALTPQRVRWIYQNETLTVETEDFVPSTTPIILAISQYPLTESLQRTDVKTSHRDFYDGERIRIQSIHPDIGEVIFLNMKGELCEGSFTNIFVDLNGLLLTPPLSAGLLPGILRAALLENGTAKETTLSLDDIRNADKIWVGNSLRGLMEAKFLTLAPL